MGLMPSALNSDSSWLLYSGTGTACPRLLDLNYRNTRVAPALVRSIAKIAWRRLFLVNLAAPTPLRLSTRPGDVKARRMSLRAACLMAGCHEEAHPAMILRVDFAKPRLKD